MAYSSQDKLEIAFQNANNAAATIIAGLVTSDDGSDITGLLGTFDVIQQHIFNKTKSIQVDGPAAPAAAPRGSGFAKPVANAPATGFSGGDEDVLPAKADGTPRYKGPAGIFAGATIGSIMAHEKGPGYLKFVTEQKATDPIVVAGLNAALARHGKA